MTGEIKTNSTQPTKTHWLGTLRRHWLAGAILLAFVALGILYSITTPTFEAPDEPWHYRYVKHLVDGKGLPPIFVSEDEWEQGEAHQPPLFYTLGALLTRHVPISPDEPLYERNPYAALGLPHASGNRNAVLHLETDEPPYQGVSLAVHILRWFNVFCSTLTVLLAYLLGLEVAPRRRGISLGAMALTAFNPQFLFISAAANNDALVTLLSTLTLYLAVRVVRGKARAWVTPAILGVVIGLAALTKLSGLSLLILLPLAYWLRFQQIRPRDALRDLWLPVLLGGLLAVLVGGWWYARNALLYQDPLGMRAVRAAFSIRSEALPLGELLQILLGAVISYWGVFGWMNVLTDELFYIFVRTLSALGLVGGILFVARLYWHRSSLRSYPWQPLMLMAVWVLLSFLSLLQWTQMVVGPQGRLLFPAIAAISLFIAIGLMGWFAYRSGYAVVVAISLLLLTASVVIPGRSIAPAYRPPARMDWDEVPADIQELDVAFGDELFLLGYRVLGERTQVGEDLNLELYWLCRKAMQDDYTFYVHVFGREEARIGGIDTYPGEGLYPTRLWLPGEVLRERYRIPISDEAEAPVAATIRVGVYTLPDITYLPAVDAQGRDLSASAPIGRVAIDPAQASTYQPAKPLQVNLGNLVQLVGYDTYPTTPLANQPWEVTLYWKCLAHIPRDYTVFMHLFNSRGERVTQVDQQPLAGSYPTSYWRVGEQIKDTHRINLPAELPPDTYTLQVGLYWLETLERLPILDSTPPANYVPLLSVRIPTR